MILPNVGMSRTAETISDKEKHGMMGTIGSVVLKPTVEILQALMTSISLGMMFTPPDDGNGAPADPSPASAPEPPAAV